MNEKEKELKKNQKIVIKRLIYAVLLFFVVPIVNLAFSAFGTSGNDRLLNQFEDMKKMMKMMKNGNMKMPFKM